LTDRPSLAAFAFEFTIQGIRNVNRGSHIRSLPYLWLEVKDALTAQRSPQPQYHRQRTVQVEVSVVPAAAWAERCALLSQCAPVEPAPTTPPIRIPADADETANQHASGCAAAGFHLRRGGRDPIL